MRNYGWDEKAQKCADKLSKEETALFVNVLPTFLDEYDWKMYRTKELSCWKKWLDGHFEIIETLIYYPFLFIKIISKLVLISIALLIIVGFIASH